MKSVEYYTPEFILNKARFVMGCIDIDPTPAQFNGDGFSKEWTGRVWLNPPFGRDVGKWFGKLRDSVYQKKTTEFIVLWKCAPDTKAWQIITTISDIVAFPRGRINFRTPEGIKSRTTFPVALFYGGPHVERFKWEFKDIADFWKETYSEPNSILIR